MERIIKSKSFSLGLALIFFLFSSPYLLPLEGPDRGSLTGFVYAEDENTPAKGVVIKMRNLSTGALFESGETGDDGKLNLKISMKGSMSLVSAQKSVISTLKTLSGSKPEKP